MRIGNLKQPGTKSRSAAATLIATGVAALALGACGGGDEPAEQTLRFKDREGELTESVDSPPKTLAAQREITPGDQIVTTRQLLDSSDDRAGTVHEVCAVTVGRNRDATEMCEGVVELEDGSVSFSKAAKLSQPAPPPQPITGGTGAYEGASGVITSSIEEGPMVEIQLLLP